MYRWTGGTDEEREPAPCGQILAALALAAVVIGGFVLLAFAVTAVR